jgi:hypothetical protein
MTTSKERIQASEAAVCRSVREPGCPLDEPMRDYVVEIRLHGVSRSGPKRPFGEPPREHRLGEDCVHAR